MKKPSNYWTKEKVIKEAKKYSIMSEWRNNSPKSYKMASNLGILKEITKNMKGNIKWTDEMILKEAKKYKSKTEWNKNSPKSYAVAKSRKLVKKINDSYYQTIFKNNEDELIMLKNNIDKNLKILKDLYVELFLDFEKINKLIKD